MLQCGRIMCTKKSNISSFAGYSGMAKVKGYSEYDGLFKEVVKSYNP